MKTFEQFLNEFNSKDKDLIRSLSDYFTISVEYELVANFPLEDEPFLETDKEVEHAFQYVRDQVLLDMSRGKLGLKFDETYKLPRKKLEENERLMFEENDLSKLSKKEIKNLHQRYSTWTWVNFFIDYLLSKVDPDDEKLTDKRINKPWDTDTDDYIATLVLKNCEMFIFGQNMEFLQNKMKKYLPKFWKKYHKTFKFELESDLDKPRILEFSSKSYLNGLEETFEQIDDFYEEFDKQDFWYMDNQRTALHVNIGVKDKNVRWNPLKGLLILHDMDREKNPPFVFSDMMWRMNSRYNQSLLDAIRRNLTGEIEKEYETDDEDKKHFLEFRHRERLSKHKEFLKQNIDKLDIHNIEQTENFFNKYLIDANKDFYIKEFGIKLTELEYEPGYVEFRYPGGKISKDVFKDKILYFCYIVYLMTNVEYKKREYHKKLYKYIEDIKSILLKETVDHSDVDPYGEEDWNDEYKVGDKIDCVGHTTLLNASGVHQGCEYTIIKKFGKDFYGLNNGVILSHENIKKFFKKVDESINH